MAVFFNKKIYSISAINRAAKVYKEIAILKIVDNKNKIKVQIKSKDKEIKNILTDEFCNYVLSETQKFK